MSGPSWVFESGPAIERRRRSPSADGTSGGEHEKRVSSPLVRGFGVPPP